MPILKPRFVPLGDQSLLIRFGDRLDADANSAAIALAARLAADLPRGVVEVTPNLVSVLLTFDPRVTDAAAVAGELRVLPPEVWEGKGGEGARHRIAVTFDGADLTEVATELGFSVPEFVAAHCAALLRVLATGFAPGFVYCGFHEPRLHLPRRNAVRPQVPAGTVLFAAGQTAIAATSIPTGWHVIGRTAFRNFDPDRDPPTLLRAGDSVAFEAME